MNKKDKTKKTLTQDDINDILKNQTVRKKVRVHTTSKWIAVFLIAAIILTGGAWGILTMIDYNNTKVYVKDGLEGLSLSETADFAHPTTNLTMKGPSNFNAVTYSHININEDILSRSGFLGATSYINYSFYLKNVSELKTCTYSSAVEIKKATKNSDDALRFLVIRTQNGVSTYSIYAKPKADNSPEAICYDTDVLETQQPISSRTLVNAWGFGDINNTTTPFLGAMKIDGNDRNFVYENKDSVLQPNEVVKYTFFIWLEGSDADCKDHIIGGFCNFDINFAVQSYGQPTIN